MKQRPAKKAARTSTDAHPHPLVIDSSAIRKKARQDYEKAKRALARGQDQLEAHQKKDLPEFDRWLNSQFGPLLTALREIDRMLQEKRQLLLEIQSLAWTKRLSHWQAYQEVMRRREHPENEPPLREEDASGQRPDADDAFETEAADEPDPFEDFEESFAEAGDAFRKFFNGPGGAFDPLGQPSPKRPVQKRIKELYRSLARKLHPDAQREMTAQKREWWHQVQEAYAEGDAERLEVILTLCEVEEKGSAATTSVWLLGRIAAQLKRALRQVQRELFNCRRSQAWNFTKQSDHQPLAREIEFELRADLRGMQSEVNELEAQFQGWAARSAGRKPTRPRARKVDRAQAHFYF